MSVSGTPRSSLDPTAVLDRLDWQLGEIGRRQHRFAWLRDPRSGGWLAVDAYYPGNRVVVIATDDAALTALCEDLVPRNDLYLVRLSGAELTADSAELAKRLRARLQIGGWEPRAGASGAIPAPVEPQRLAPPRRADALARRDERRDERREPPRRSVRELTDVAAHADPELDDFGLPADARIAAPTLPADSSLRAAHRPGAPATRRTRATQSEGMGVGITLVVIVALELVVGGAVIGLDAGQYVLGFGFLLDACARVLGLIAASQAGDVDAAWTSVLFGSPALWGLEESAGADLAPVARVTAIIAGCVIALGVVLVIL